MTGTLPGPDGQPRCAWCAGVEAFIPYHDTEWGRPEGDDTLLFEKLTLESFQSGLSWRTILDKRDGFRRAFAGFDAAQVARFDAHDVARLLADASIVRHRGKIEATLNNAARVLETQAEFGSLGAYLWRFEPPPHDRPEPQTASVNASATALARDMKKRGWTFLGPTTLFAFMQAAGLLNDHALTCALRAPAQAARDAFVPPPVTQASNAGR